MVLMTLSYGKVRSQNLWTSHPVTVTSLMSGPIFKGENKKRLKLNINSWFVLSKYYILFQYFFSVSIAGFKPTLGFQLHHLDRRPQQDRVEHRRTDSRQLLSASSRSRGRHGVELGGVLGQVQVREAVAGWQKGRPHLQIRKTCPGKNSDFIWEWSLISWFVFCYQNRKK